MKVAVAYDNGEVFQYFGHTKQFKIYEIDGSGIAQTSILSTADKGDDGLSGLLASCGVEILICGGIGLGGRNAVAEKGIKLYGGVVGSADDAVEALIWDTLSYDPNVTCRHNGGDGDDCSDEKCTCR